MVNALGRGNGHIERPSSKTRLTHRFHIILYVPSYSFLLLDLVCFICVVVGCRYFLNGGMLCRREWPLRETIINSSNTSVSFRVSLFWFDLISACCDNISKYFL